MNKSNQMSATQSRSTKCSVITEGYSVSLVGELTMIVVVATPEKRSHVFSTLCHQVADRAYFTLEYEDKTNHPRTRDIYFWMWISHEVFFEIYDKYHNLIVNSSGISFGYAAHTSDDEVYLSSQKTIKIFTKTAEKYLATLDELGFTCRECLRIAEPSSEEEQSQKAAYGDAPEIMEMLDDLIRDKLRFGKRYEIE